MTNQNLSLGNVLETVLSHLKLASSVRALLKPYGDTLIGIRKDQRAHYVIMNFYWYWKIIIILHFFAPGSY